MSRIYKEFRFYPSEFKSVSYDNTMLVAHLSLEAVNDQFEMDQKELDKIYDEGYCEGKKDERERLAELIHKLTFEYADAMLAERNKT